MNLNKCFFGGNLTRDPETRTIQSGKSVTKFGVAINNSWTGADGEKREETTFVDLEAWGKTAEVIAKHFSKGKPIFVEARAKLEQWDDKESGQKRSKMKFVVESFQFCGGDKKSGSEVESKPSGGIVKPEDIPW